MKPSVDWITKPNNPEQLVITEAAFEYELPDGDIVHEVFKTEDDSLSSFVPDFLDRYDLEKDKHYNAVEETIRQSFCDARAEKQRLKDLLLETYDPHTLEAMCAIKIYPKNEFIPDSAKGPHVSSCYGKAINKEDFPAPFALPMSSIVELNSYLYTC
jgi:hypothetical protein